MEKIKNFISKYNLIALLILIFFCSLTYIFNGLRFTTSAGIIYRVIIAAIIVLYLVLFTISLKPKVSRPLIILSITYIFTSIISIFVSPLIAKQEITLPQYLLGIFTVFSNVSSIYLFLESSKINENRLLEKLFILIFITSVIFMCFYTYIFQYKAIYKTLTDSYGWNYDVTSIFYEKTIYGFFLSTASIYCAFYSIKNNKYLLLLLILFFGINAFLSRNKTSILVIGLLIIVSVTILLKKHFSTKKSLCIILLGSALGLISTLIILVAFLPGLSNIRYFVQTSILNDGLVVMKSRFAKWGGFLSCLNNPFNIIFGFGERISRFVVTNNVTDNSFLYSLETGGIIKVALHLLLVLYLYKNGLLKKERVLRVALISIILISCLFEDNNLFGFNVTALSLAPIAYSIFD